MSELSMSMFATQADYWKARAEAAEAENTTLRTLLPKLGAPCAYCGLTEIAKCAHGFPGCPQADDMIAGEDEAFREVCARMKAAEADARRYRWLRDKDAWWRAAIDAELAKEGK